MSARVADGRDGVNLQNENVTTATHTCVPQPRMGLLSFSCAQLGRVLARYEGGHASEHGLYVALVFLTVASAANVIGAGALWAIPTHSFWRAVAAFLVIVIAGAVVTSYFIVSGRRDSMALGAYGRTHDELVRNARKCRLVLPDKRLSLRDPGTRRRGKTSSSCSSAWRPQSSRCARLASCRRCMNPPRNEVRGVGKQWLR